MCKCVKMVPSALFAMFAGTVVLIGCSRTVTVSVVDDAGTPVASVSAQSPSVAIPSDARNIDESPASVPAASDDAAVDSPATSPASDDSAVSEEPKSSGDSAGDNASDRESNPPARGKAPPERAKGLGQFGGGGGGGMMGGGGMGGGGMGGGMMGGMGGGMGGMGGGGGGGVSIDPKIQLKKDSSGKLDQRRKEATGAKPNKGGFSSD